MPAPTETTPPPTPGNVDITTIFYNGVVGSSEPDEYVEIKNNDCNAILLQNWTLSDAANHVFTFPSFVMTPGQTGWVYKNHAEWRGFSYGSGSKPHLGHFMVLPLLIRFNELWDKSNTLVVG